MMIKAFKEPLCSAQKLDCVDKISVDTSSCMKPCSGLIVTSFAKSEKYKDLKLLYSNIMTQYDSFKTITSYPPGLIGIKSYLNFQINTINKFPSKYTDYEWINNLRFVRIYFDTPTFDKITMDKAAKFVDMLSAIGGTMGLLTGFSIISGVEILYFAAKIGWNIIQENKNKTI